MDYIQDRITADEYYKKERDRQMVREGLHLCEQRKYERIMEKKREQQEVCIFLSILCLHLQL